MAIHPTAQVDPRAVVEEGAEIGPEAKVGPFAILGPEVRLGARVEIKPHGYVTGRTTIGADSVIFPFAVVGEVPQDLKFAGESTALEIGERTRIREHATINVGTTGGGGVTRIGDDCLIMSNTHVAHDSQIGNKVILVSHVAIAGHVVIEDEVIVGGLSGVHQFVRVGRGAMIGALTMVPKDVIPYGMVHASRGSLQGLNLIGLKRRGMNREQINELRAAYEQLGDGSLGSFQERAEALGAETGNDRVAEIVEFITGASDRHFLTPE